MLEQDRLIQDGYVLTNAQKTKVMQKRKLSAKTLAEPLGDAVMDLRQIKISSANTTQKPHLTPSRYMKRYGIVFTIILLLVTMVFIFRYYYGEVSVKERSYNIELREIEIPSLELPGNE